MNGSEQKYWTFSKNFENIICFVMRPRREKNKMFNTFALSCTFSVVGIEEITDVFDLLIYLKYKAFQSVERSYQLTVITYVSDEEPIV